MTDAEKIEVLTRALKAIKYHTEIISGLKAAKYSEWWILADNALEKTKGETK